MISNLASYVEEKYYEECKELFEYYGEELTLEWLKEEVGEYIEVCCRKENKFNISDVYSELADVIILSYQLQRFGNKELKIKSENIVKKTGGFIGFLGKTPLLRRGNIKIFIVDKMERSIRRFREVNNGIS